MKLPTSMLIGLIAMPLLTGCVSPRTLEAELDADAYRTEGARYIELGDVCHKRLVGDNPCDRQAALNLAVIPNRALPSFSTVRKATSNIDTHLNVKATSLLEGLQQGSVTDAEARSEGVSNQTIAEAKASSGDRTAELAAELKIKSELSESMTVLTFDLSRLQLREELRRRLASDLEDYLKVPEARIATGIQKVSNHSSWRKLEGSGEISVVGEYDGVGGDIKFTTSRGEEITLKLGDGTTIAYRIDRICWDENRDDERIAMYSVVDYPGIDSNACTTGSSRIDPTLSSWDWFSVWFTGIFD